MRVRTFLAPALAAGALSISAQSLKPGLSLIPATVEDVEIYQDPASFEANSRVLSDLLGSESHMSGLPLVGFGTGDLAQGPVFSAEYPAPIAAKGKPKPPSRFLAVLQVKDPKPLMARLHAKPNEGIWAYRDQDAAEAPFERFAASKAGFLLVSNDRATLLEALAAKQVIASEVDSVSEAWLLSHDLSVFVSSQETKSDLADLVKGTQSSKAGALASVHPRLQALALKAQASVTHFALGLDVAKDGTARGAFRAFYAPGSPLAAEAAALPPLGAHPLAGLPADPFALAMGGQWPEALNFLAADPDIALAPFRGHEVPDGLKADYLAALKAQSAQTQSMALLMAPPKAGDALLGGTVALVRVKDARAYIEGQAKVADLQGQLAKAAGMEPFSTFEKGALPDAPSFSLTVDLGRAQGGQAMPPQASMIFGFLFGGTVMRQSAAQLDAHTVVSVFGTPEDLKWALLRAKKGGPLVDSPLLKREDELLPAASRFSLYLDLKGLRDMAQTVAAAFGKGQSPLPEVAPVPPFGMAVLCDAGGFEIRGGAQSESLKALRDLFADVKRRMPAPPKTTEE